MGRNNYRSSGLLALFLAALLGLCPLTGGAPALAAPRLEVPPAGAEAGKPGQIIWKLTGLGRLAAEPLAGPNGNLHLAAGNKLLAVDPEHGRVIWEAPGPAGGKADQPVFAGNGAIFLPGRAAIQEIKLNGSAGWNFTVYPGGGGGGGGGARSPLLTRGPDSFLYLPLPDALYVLDVWGRYRWALLHWDTVDRYTAKPSRDREILACAGSPWAVFVVTGKKREGYRLAAVNKKGDLFWRYWLGQIKECYLLTGATAPTGGGTGGGYGGGGFEDDGYGGGYGGGGEELLIAAVNPAKVDRFNKGKIYAFAFRSDSGGSGRGDNGNGSEGGNGNGDEGSAENEGKDGRLLWTYSLPFNDLTAPALAADGTLYFCAGKRLYAVNTANGDEKWALPLLNVVSPPAVDAAGGRIYAGSSDGRLFAVSATGRMIWERMLDSALECAPLAAPGGHLYVFTSKGTLYKIKDN